MTVGHRLRGRLLAAAGLVLAIGSPGAARADNTMGYQLLSAQDAASLPRNHGSLGMTVKAQQQLSDAGMTFDILQVLQIRNGSPAAKAGLHAGDQIIAVDGKVFPSLATFVAYVGSVRPGTSISVDYMPANGGPAQAQRVAVVVGAAGLPVKPAASSGMSTGSKLAIGVGAAALLGCYEMGCFSHHQQPASNAPPATAPQPQ